MYTTVGCSIAVFDVYHARMEKTHTNWNHQPNLSCFVPGGQHIVQEKVWSTQALITVLQPTIRSQSSAGPALWWWAPASYKQIANWIQVN